MPKASTSPQRPTSRVNRAEHRRKRNPLACNYCRRRKKRCDGGQPSCSLCEHARVVCSYDNSHASISQQLAAVTTSSSPTARPGSWTHGLVGDQHIDNQAEISLSRPAASELGVPGPPILIPTGHLTTAGSLLLHSRIQKLVGHFPSNIFSTLEMQRALTPEFSLPWGSDIWTGIVSPDAENVHRSCEVYLTQVHPYHPILDRDDFVAMCTRCSVSGFSTSTESAVCYACFALAEVSPSSPSAGELAEDNWGPGHSYLRAALSIVVERYVTQREVDALLPQALYLCAVCYGFYVRPVQAWRLVHMASTSLQHVTAKYQAKEDWAESEDLVRLAWAIFILECDLMAEHHFPRSGIEHVVEGLPLPQSGSGRWLSGISGRALLNRVHYGIYTADPYVKTRTQNASDVDDYISMAKRHMLTPISPSVTEELSRQLDVWYDMLQPPIEHTKDFAASADRLEIAILLRYYSAREAICRPWLLQTLNIAATAEVPEAVLSNAKVCIQSCTQYLFVAKEWLKRPSVSTEAVGQSVFAVTILLTLASLSSRFPEVIEEIDALHSVAIQLLHRWAFNGSCIESMHFILQTARQKLRTNHLENAF